MSRITDYGFLFKQHLEHQKQFGQQYSVVPNEQQFCTETIKSSRDRHKQ